jgi:prevent-host-death family protein
MRHDRFVKVIAQRELRNDVSRVLREVAAGEHFRITVAGRPVADLVPLEDQRHTFVPRDELQAILDRVPLDTNFTRQVDGAIGMTVDEL